MRNYLWPVFHYSLLILLLTVFVYLSDSKHPLRIDLQNAVFDQFNKMEPRAARDDVVIVDVDEASLKHLGQWPWSRKIMADLTQSLTKKGAKVIAFDGVFAEEDRTSPQYYLSQLPVEVTLPQGTLSGENLDYDKVFARAIKESKIFVTAFTYGQKTVEQRPVDKKRLLARSDVKKTFIESASKFNGVAVNLPNLARNAAGNGSFMAKPDADGVLRRAAMVFSDGQNLYPSLSLETLRVALTTRKGMAYIAETPPEEKTEIDTKYRVLLNDKQLKIPVESDGVIYVYYRYFCNAEEMNNQRYQCQKQDYISAHKFLDDSFVDEATAFVKDKIVLIGASAEGLKDLRSTPLRPFRPGVEVHANAIEQILSGEYLLRPAITKGVEATFITLVGLSFIILSAFIGILISVLLCVTLVGIASFGAYLMYVDYGLLLDPVYPSVCVITIFTLSTILSHARAEMKRKHIRSAFGMYVAPDVMKDLERNPEKLKLGGELRNITVMFTDIRKFTSISEGLDPTELINLMNEFLTAMTDVVMEYKGTVDKYIGDAMMCFWNAPREVDNHGRLACLAALEMHKRLKPINKKIIEQAKKVGKDPVLLRAGVGVNTGECAVGNMGSKQRFAYSALGDGVNMASRFEGLTKQYGVDILIGEKTYHDVTDFAVLEVDLVKVVGKGEPERVYALFGDDKAACKDSFQRWRQLHCKMLNAYRAQDTDKALEYASECKRLCFDSAKPLYDMYEKRIETMKESPWPEGWSGVFVAEMK